MGVVDKNNKDVLYKLSHVPKFPRIYGFLKFVKEKSLLYKEARPIDRGWTDNDYNCIKQKTIPQPSTARVAGALFQAL